MKRRTIPTKQELLQLQKIYRTDKRIGEALGGVSEQLIAYWRRKKGIGKVKFPKYSLQEIKELWERFGDDEKAGAELQITKQAFYRWRKTYRLLYKPATLKLKQLELKFYDERRLTRGGDRLQPIQSALQKVISFHSSDLPVPIGGKVTVPLDLILQFLPDRIHVCSLGRNNSGDSTDRADFATLYDLFDAGYFLPGRIVLADSPVAYALSVANSLIKLVPSEEIAGMADLPETEFELHPTVKVELSSASVRHRAPFDLACQVAEKLESLSEQDFVLEFCGQGMEKLPLDDRMALLAYVSTLTGRHAFVKPDHTLLNLFSHFSDEELPVPFSDKGTQFLEELQIAESPRRGRVLQLCSRQFLTDPGQQFISRIGRVRIGPQTGGSLDDLRLLAPALKGYILADNVSLLVVPNSRATYIEALKRRYIQPIVEAGGLVGNILPGCRSRLPASEIELTTEIDDYHPQVYLMSTERIIELLKRHLHPL